MAEKSRFTKDHFIEVNQCPWCGAVARGLLYEAPYHAGIQECKECGLVYSDRILNKCGLELYWGSYLTEVHTKDAVLVEKRNKMYAIEYQQICRFMNVAGRNVLDVGCGSGGFLEHFQNAGACCYGVEYGREAADEAARKFQVWRGEFPKMEINENFDLIIFRGSLQYCINPKSYLEKAMCLLNPGGLLFITSTPNARSLCFRLFKEHFTLPVCMTDYYGFHESLITGFLQERNGRLLCSQQIYLETPYADRYNDILNVAKAIEYTRRGEKIDFLSPPFFDNMLSLIYQKGENK